MSEYNIQMNKYNALNAEYDQLYPQPMKHASTHAKDGDDPITPSSIGAAELGADGKVLTSQLPSIEADAYTKVQTLSDTTKTLFGLDATAVPDDVFGVLSRFHKGLGNEYVWSKTKIEDSEKYDIAVEEPFKHGTAAPWYYSDSFHVEGNQFVLDNPQSATPSASLDNAIKGKYFYSSPSATEMRKMPEDAVITDGSPITVSYIFSYTNARIETGPVLYGYVNSPDPNAYPPAVSDGYTYTALGQLGAKVQIATGSYTGTGTYGSSNPNSLTFDFEPKIWGVLCVKSKSGTFGSLLNINSFLPFGVVGAESSIIGTINSYVSNNTVQNQQINLSGSYNGNTVSWYSVDVDKQLNNSTYEYYYIAIG